MKILFIGRTEWLYNTIELISKKKEIKIIGIISSKESPEYQKSEDDFKDYSKELGIKYLSAAKLSKNKIIEIFGKEIDLAISVNYPTIISSEVISLFKLGILNAHGGDLPKYRGNAAAAWAIINGEKKVGLCIHKMIGGELDSGDIISKEYILLDDKISIEEIYSEFKKRIPKLFLKSVEHLMKDSRFVLEKQSKNSDQILRCYPRKPEDGKVNWSESAVKINRLIRASSEPYSGAFTYYNDEKIKIWKTEVIAEKSKWIGIPGQFAEFNNDGSLNVLTGKDKIKIIEMEKNNQRGKPNFFFKSVRDRFKNTTYDI